MCGDGHAHGQDGFPSTECTTNISTQYSPQLISQLSDAHCHIQDDRQNIYALVDSWKNSTNADTAVAPLYAGNICLMGVQPSKDLGLDITQDSAKEIQEAIESLTVNMSTVPSHSATPTNIVTVSWNDTDTKGDWDLVSKLAHDYPDRFVPSFGIHPWFTHKYQPLQVRDSNAVEIGGARRHGKNTTTTEGASAEEATLSFSSTALTPVPGPGVQREAFLAMSKQLQEQMAKESRGRELGQSQTTNTTESSHQPQDASKNHEVAEESNDKEAPIQLSSHLQHQDQTSPISPRLAHYQQVLQVPNSAPPTYLADLAARLPEPRALEPAMKELRRKLEEHPNAVLGEIGLDRIARIPEPSTPALTTDTPDDSSASGGQKKTTLALTSIQHQLNLVREQLKVAASLDRAVSFHCVQAYGHWHDFLIQEGKRLKQMEFDQEYRQQLQQIHANGGTPTLDSSLLGGQEAGSVRLSKQGAARLRRAAKEAEWERHVASTVQESSDEEDEDSEDETFGGSSSGNSSSEERKKRSGSNLDESIAPAPLVLPPVPVFEQVLPPRLCMHSYGGSVDMMRAFAKMNHPPEIFFSFSILINGRLQERKLQELISAVPEDRLLIESDHHSHTLLDSLLMDMVKKVSEIRGWSIEETVQKTTRNWHRFVYGH